MGKMPMTGSKKRPAIKRNRPVVFNEILLLKKNVRFVAILGKV